MGEQNTQEAHHCDGCGCVQKEEAPSVERVRELIEEQIPQTLEDVRLDLAPYRRLENIFPGFGAISYTYDADEGDIPMQIRFFLYRGEEAALRLEWSVLGYEFRLTYDKWSRSSGRDTQPYGDKSERTPLDDLAETPVMRRAVVLLAEEVLPEAIRAYRRDIQRRVRERFSPEAPKGQISETHRAIVLLIRAIRAHEAQDAHIRELRQILKETQEGFSATRGHIKRKAVEQLRVQLEEKTDGIWMKDWHLRRLNLT